MLLLLLEIFLGAEEVEREKPGGGVLHTRGSPREPDSTGSSVGSSSAEGAEPAEVEAAAAEAAGPEVEAEVAEAEVTVAEGAVAEAGFN